MNGIENILHSFSSLFWLNEKRWFIAIETGRQLIYSVPRFSPEKAYGSCYPNGCVLPLDDPILYNYKNAHSDSTHRLQNVKELTLFFSRYKKSDMSTHIPTDVNQVERLLLAYYRFRPRPSLLSFSSNFSIKILNSFSILYKRITE